jgi:hypothetical protein
VKGSPFLVTSVKLLFVSFRAIHFLVHVVFEKLPFKGPIFLTMRPARKADHPTAIFEPIV